MMRSAEGFELDVRVRYPQWFEAELAALRPQIQEAQEGAPRA
jgi:hypothetical protein